MPWGRDFRPFGLMFPPLLAQKFILLEGHSAPLESDFVGKPKPNAKLRLFI
jgi:hypothetical protein